uniref:Uncharacterized protein n=1 Tax=Meloidogyne hapla TaxID=6305 RepID=A0A1I8BY43_MELHA
MESLKLILILLVTVVILALYKMNKAIWPYSIGFQENSLINDKKQPCQVLSEQYEFLGRAFRHEIMEFFLFVNNSHSLNVTKHRNVYKMMVRRLKNITSGFSNPDVSTFAKMPDIERNISMRGLDQPSNSDASSDYRQENDDDLNKINNIEKNSIEVTNRMLTSTLISKPLLIKNHIRPTLPPFFPKINENTKFLLMQIPHHWNGQCGGLANQVTIN